MSTITDVANLAGVSRGTVSRVINGAENVHPDTRARVEKAVANLNYRPNFQARSLRSKRTNTLALAIPELTNYFWTSVARGVQDASQAQGYNVFLCNTAGRSADYLETLESMVGRVDGMILTRRSESVIVAPDEPSSSAKTINSRQIPLVFVGQSQAAAWNVDNVYSDSVSGAFALTEHLIRLGHRHIAMITGRQSSSSARDRVTGYCVALAQANIPIDAQLVCWGEYDRKSAQHLTHELLQTQPLTSAIVAANNEIAIGVMSALEQRQSRVPDDIAVVCMDDFYPDSRFASIMTVAAQLPYDLGINAAQLLLDRLNSDHYLRPRTVALPTRLIVRMSCGSGQPAAFDAESSFDRVKGRLIATLSRAKIAAHVAIISPVVQVDSPINVGQLISAIKSQTVQLRQALRQQSTHTQPVPHIEYAITNNALYRYVLEREPDYEFVHQHPHIIPEDQLEFALRTGIAAVLCRFPGKPTLLNSRHDQQISSKGSFFDFPALTDQLHFFDRYVRAAQTSSVGIAADFRSIVGDTLTTAEALGLTCEDDLFENIVDELFRYQSKVVQLICDRFASDLSFVVFSDCLADENGLRIPLDIYDRLFSHRLQQLIHPALEHDLPVVLYTPGHIQSILPLIQELGFDGIYPIQPELNDLKSLQQQAAGNLSIIGGIPASLLIQGNEQMILEQVRQTCALLGANGGYVVGVASEINDEIAHTHFITMLQAIRATQSA